jgi:S-adenosylmethionine uptake transporter
VASFLKSYTKPSKVSAGIIMMIISAFFISLLYVIVKILTKEMDFSSNQVALLYKSSIVIITLISCIKLGFAHHLRTTKIVFHALRGFFSIAGSLAMFYAVSILEVVDAAAISELTPTVMAITGIILFNEKLTTPKVILFLGSIIGVLLLIDLKNFDTDIEIGYFYAFFALISWSINNVIIKKLTKTEHSRAQLFYSSFFASIFALPVAFFSFSFDLQNYSFDLAVRRWPDFSLAASLLMFFAGVASLLHKISFFKAYKLADISIVGPFDYLRLPFTGMFAYLILGETVNNIYSLLGYAVILGSGIYFIMHKKNSSKIH